MAIVDKAPSRPPRMDASFQMDQARKERDSYYQSLVGARDFIQERVEHLGRQRLDAWIVCGSGLAGLPNASGVHVLDRIPMDDPHLNWLTPQAPGHGQDLLLAQIGDQTVGIMTGRTHPYDTDFSPQQMRLATSPLVVAKGLGVNWMITTSAVGALDNGHIQKGDIVVNGDIKDDMGVNPLIGLNDDRLGPRFMPKFPFIDSKLFSQLEQFLPEDKVHLGIYNIVAPPFYEGTADIEFHSYRELLKNSPEWVSVFGMSQGMETDVLLHFNDPSTNPAGFDRKVPFLSISVITNIIPSPHLPSKDAIRRAGATNPNPTTHEEVIEEGNKAGEVLIPAVVKMIESFSEN